MQINIRIYCPQCHSGSIVRNGKKKQGKQNYLCKECGRQFISDHERTYRGTCSWVTDLIKIMLVRGVGVRDAGVILSISIKKVLSVLASTRYRIQPKRQHYDTLEIDEFWTYVGNKGNKKWLIYAYHRDSGEIVAYIWGKRDLETAKRLRNRLVEQGISYERIACDWWESFRIAFSEDEQEVGKQYTVGIEGNNCRLRHRVRRVFRKTCCFSKKLINHLRAFNMTFFYLNFGHL